LKVAGPYIHRYLRKLIEKAFLVLLLWTDTSTTLPQVPRIGQASDICRPLRAVYKIGF
jgi:hypothetical protein